MADFNCIYFDKYGSFKHGRSSTEAIKISKKN
jgi:hypothetical protein